MFGEHHYAVEVEWQGDRGEGTSNYRAYGRQHVVRAEGKLHDLAGSSDRVFHGDRERWNPEELLIAALSQCHMLSYLHVATRHGVVVRGYTDAATGTMLEDGRGGGAFSDVPSIVLVLFAVTLPSASGVSRLRSRMFANVPRIITS